jgi:hypothetical protein
VETCRELSSDSGKFAFVLTFAARETFPERVNGLFLLPANEFEIEEFVNRAEIGGVARNQIGPDSPRSQCNQNIEMKLSGLVNIVPFCPDQSTYDTAGLDPFSLAERDDP